MNSIHAVKPLGQGQVLLAPTTHARHTSTHTYTYTKHTHAHHTHDTHAHIHIYTHNTHMLHNSFTHTHVQQILASYRYPGSLPPTLHGLWYCRNTLALQHSEGRGTSTML